MLPASTRSSLKTFIYSFIGSSLIACSVSVQAGECEPAVDLVDSNDAVNRINDCDYSDKGLNGWFKQSAKTAPEPVLESTTAGQVGRVVVSSADSVPGVTFELTSTDIKSALDLLQARFTLVEQAVTRCEGGAVLDEERYKLGSQGYTQLKMRFYCY